MVNPAPHTKFRTLPNLSAQETLTLRRALTKRSPKIGARQSRACELDSHPHDPACCWLHSEDPAHRFCLTRLAPYQQQWWLDEDHGVGLKLHPLNPVNQLNVLPYGHPARWR